MEFLWGPVCFANGLLFYKGQSRYRPTSLSFVCCAHVDLCIPRNLLSQRWEGGIPFSLRGNFEAHPAPPLAETAEEDRLYSTLGQTLSQWVKQPTVSEQMRDENSPVQAKYKYQKFDKFEMGIYGEEVFELFEEMKFYMFNDKL